MRYHLCQDSFWKVVKTAKTSDSKDKCSVCFLHHCISWDSANLLLKNCGKFQISLMLPDFGRRRSCTTSFDLAVIRLTLAIWLFFIKVSCQLILYNLLIYITIRVSLRSKFQILYLIWNTIGLPFGNLILTWLKLHFSF